MAGKSKNGQSSKALLAGIHGPGDVKRLTGAELSELAEQIRDFLVQAVAQTGGHLGPNLGVVELTIAMHRVFNSPRDTFVFDTGHQAYVHKLLTGRRDFSRLRKEDGLSGYPSRAESIHDVLESSHASAGLSWADGIAAARTLDHETERHTVVVVGDGALTGGMSWEALNNISGHSAERLVIVVNDNGRSYAPTIGGLAEHLNGLRTTHEYERVLAWGKRTLRRGGRFGEMIYGALHGLKKGLKDVVVPQVMFEDLGIKYIGTIDGHDIEAMTAALEQAKAYRGPVMVHAITEKGRGYTPAEADTADRFHAVGVIHPETGLPVKPSRFGWTGVFAEEMVALGREDKDIVAITAAMLQPVGLAPFAAEFPERVFDVGIAEQHGAASAAGMAYAGKHPVFALYATFLNRAFDQVLMDVAMHHAGVTFVLDRAGLTGEDGASHNGQWDMSLMRLVPGLRLAAPRDGASLRRLLREAVAVSDGPTVVRYPKGEVPQDIEAIRKEGTLEILSESGEQVLIVGIGPMARTALGVGACLDAQGIGSTVVDPGWVLPVGRDLVRFAARFDQVITIEDGLITGGVGEAIGMAMLSEGITPSLRTFGIPQQFLHHATRAQLEEELGLTPERIAEQVLSSMLKI